ncbi:hypothetical protein [Streptomyces sp. CBMAI 2042]|uniref:hypothetical protein n=1 Tax=Streptomyces sp. CBMAI 2042 TaxID=2305222 RepID=UPI001F24CBFF|nr:hypothetical protein [Streptomyces sp. CBMAI 2042]
MESPRGERPGTVAYGPLAPTACGCRSSATIRPRRSMSETVECATATWAPATR